MEVPEENNNKTIKERRKNGSIRKNKTSLFDESRREVTTYPWIAGETSNSLDISREVFGGGDKSESWDSFFAGKGN